MITLNPKVDAFVENAGKWQEEFRQLRRIIRKRAAEEFKWGVPAIPFKTVSSADAWVKGLLRAFVCKRRLLSDPGDFSRSRRRIHRRRARSLTKSQVILSWSPPLKLISRKPSRWR